MANPETWLPAVAQAALQVATLHPFVSFGTLTATTTLSLLGFLPRVGPARALGLAFRSALSYGPDPSPSVRHAEVNSIRAALQCCKPQQYLVVHGAKGAGKTTLIQTALQHRPGVVEVTVSPGTSSDAIEAAAFRELAWSHLTWYNSAKDAKRIVFFFRLFTGFALRPVVVLKAKERQLTEAHAALAAAAKTLASDFGVIPIIDASENSLPAAATETEREIPFLVTLMTREQIESLPELQPMLKDLGDLKHVVWMILGGNPAVYFRLAEKWGANARLAENQCVDDVVHAFLCAKLQKVFKNVEEQLGKDKIAPCLWTQLLEKYREYDAISSMVYTLLKVDRPSPDKVLRLVLKSKGSNVIMPRDPPTRFVLRHNLSKVPSLHKLKELCAGYPDPDTIEHGTVDQMKVYEPEEAAKILQ